MSPARRSRPFRALRAALCAFLPLLVLPLRAEDAPCPDSAAGSAVGEVALEGLRTTRPFVVLRELSHREGATFSCDGWREERDRLEDLDIFADIGLRAEPAGGASGPVRLVYAFKELPPYIPFVAASKTEQDGLSLGPALASLNFLGRDLRVELISRFGGTTEFLAAVNSRWLGPLPLAYDLAAIRIDSYNGFEDFHEDSWRVKLDLEQRLGGPAEILYVGELFWLRDAEASPDRESVTLTPGADFIPRLGAGFLWDGRDRQRLPSRGLFQEFRITRNGGPLGGDADYVEYLSDTRLYVPWLGRNVLYFGALYQYRTGELGRTFPVYDRFHAGGINTLRGFGNDALQGKSEWIATVEDRFDLVKRRVVRLWKWSLYFGLQGVAGLEAASLWGHDALMEGALHAGWYGGVHLVLAGVDRIRLEVGSNTAKFEFQMDVGIMEKADAQRFRAR